MLTSYFVTCPYPGCNWFGSLLPCGSPELLRESVVPAKVVTFHCPQCRGEWQARVVGDDVKPLPLPEVAAPTA